MSSVATACALALGLSLAAARPAHAEPTRLVLPADPALAALIEQSVAARPELDAARATVEARALRRAQAGALPDPMLQLGWQNDGVTELTLGRRDGSYLSVMVAQTVPWPGKRRLQRDAAALAATQATTAVVRVRLSTEAEVRRAYLALVLVRDRLALLDQLETIWQRSLGAARTRVEAGTGPQSDLLRAQLELTRLAQRRIGLRLEEQTRVQALNRLRDHALDEPIATSIHVRDLPALARYASAFSAAGARAASPELAAAALGVRRADTELALAGEAAYPDLELGVGVMVRGDLPAMWQVTIRGPLPLSAGRRRRATAERRAWDQVARAEQRATAQLVSLRTAERRARFVALVETLALYDRGLLVQSAATTDSTLAQYIVGNVAFASVLEANAGLVADHEGYLEALATAHQILIAEAEVSLAPTPTTTAGEADGATVEGM